jgi:AraC-like DNA-binding protein
MTAGWYLAAPGEISAWRLPGDRHRFLTVEFSTAFLGRHLNGGEAGTHPVVRQAIRSTHGGTRTSASYPLPARIRRLLDTLQNPPGKGPAQGLWYQAKALELMADFFFLPTDASQSATPRQQHAARQRVERVIELLGQQLENPPTLDELGTLVGCSPYHLSRTFSSQTGMTIPQYLRQIRMERAAELLKSGRANVTEAALAVGYSSLSHFSHAFRETIGCCPGLYPLGILQPRVT